MPVTTLMLFFPKLSRKRILMYSPLAVIHDIDFFFGHGWLHNVFTLAFISYACYHLSGKNKEVTFIASYLWASHLVLDLQFIRLFYPLYKGFVSLHADVFINPSLSQGIPAYISGCGGAGADAVDVSALVRHRFQATNLPASALFDEDAAPLVSSFGLITVIYALFAIAVYRFRDRFRLS
ncbi:MAG: hypothetical protein ABH834_04525 [Candidatus Altiarchaeota archaeon]